MKLWLTGFALSIFSVPAFSQDDDPSSLNKEIKFIKEGRIELPQVNRNYEKITFDAPQGQIESQTYNYTPVPSELARLEMKIRIRPLNPDELPKLYGNYVKVGFGNYVTPYFEGFFNSKRSDKYIYGLHLKHLSSARGPVDFARTSENIAEVYGTYFLSNMAAEGRIQYKRNRYNYYGFNQELFPNIEEDSLKQVYNIFSVHTEFRNINQKDDFDYKLGLKYWLLDSRFSNENEFLADYKTGYRLADDKDIRVSGLYSYSSRKNDISGTYARHFFQITPGLFIDKGKYDIFAGITAAYTTDTVLNSKFHLYPKLHANYQVVENELTAFAGLGGEMQRNVLRSFAEENPFLAPDVPLVSTNKTFELYAGVKGNVLERLNYKARISYETYKYLPFFVNSIPDTSQFTILYEAGNSTVMNLLGALSYDFTEKLRIGLNANYYNYNLSNLEQPWHRPNVDISLLSTYNIYKKIYFNLDIFYLSGLKGRSVANTVVKLPDIFDANAKIDYKFSNAFSAFIQANNIFGKKYQRYLYYPVKGVNILAGVTYTF